MSSSFGDKDPEDAYDAGDPASVRLDVIERIVDDLRDGPDDDRHEPRRLDALRLVANLERDGVDLIRLAVIRDDLEGLWLGARYLTELADVCRSTGLATVEVDGWQTRARGSGGYDDGRPNHVIIHHTASPPSSDGWPDVDYCTFGDDDAPLCNLYLDRAGTVYVCAAGATNTNGSGQDLCGIVADDAMNSSAIGIEAGNNGTGEAWPTVQQDAYVAVVAALCAAYGIDPAQVHSHAQWAPARKVDCSGPSRYGPGTWDMPAFCDDVRDAATTPPPPPLEDDVLNDQDKGWIEQTINNVVLNIVRGDEYRGHIVAPIVRDQVLDVLRSPEYANIVAGATDA